MMILAVRYSFLFWLSISESFLIQSMESDDHDIFRISACTSRCLRQQLQTQNLHNEQQQEQDKYRHYQKHAEKQQFGKQEQQQQQQQHKQQEEHVFPLFLKWENQTLLKSCYDFCRIQNATSWHLQPLRKIHENLNLKLVCRDDRSLTFRIDAVDSGSTSMDMVRTVEATQNDVIYVIKIHAAQDAQEYSIYLSDENFFTINALKHNTTHNVTAVIVHANNEYSIIAKSQHFRTLRLGYTPAMIQDIQVRHFHVDEAMNDIRLIAEIAWKPSSDMTCHYNIICFSPESEEYDLTPLEIRDPRQLYTYHLVNLRFSSIYKIGIRAKNPNNMAKESELFWETFESPSCPAWYNYNFTICAPLRPKDLAVEQNYIQDHIFSLNISWQPPEYFPDYYTLQVMDLAEDGNTHVMNVSKLECSFLIPRIELHGFMFEVHLTAYTPGGNTSAEITDLTKMLVIVPDKHHVLKLLSAILAPIFCFAILILIILLLCQRRAKLKRYKERCKYFENLEKKEPINTKATLDFATKHITLLNSTRINDDLSIVIDSEEKIYLNDAMEIERNDVTLLEILGEGAFGLVRRGIYHDEELGSREVAVKMLKIQPSTDDVRAFRREIEVMKSVEQHPNIVGIIGHYTKAVSEMMLLTEYCSLGNLLNFLRKEWKYMQELNIKGGAIVLLSASNISLTGNKSADYHNLKQRNMRGCANSKSIKIKHKRLTRTFNDSGTNEKNIYRRPERNINKNTGNSSSNNNNNRSATNIFNLDSVVIEKLKQKYHSINNNACNSLTCDVYLSMPKTTTTKETISTPNPTIINGNCVEEKATVEVKKTSVSDTKITTKTTATDNKSYGYPEICTSACKCHVDMINAKEKHKIEITNSKAETTTNNVSSASATSSPPALLPLATPLPFSKRISKSDGCYSYVPTIRIRNCDCKLLLGRNNRRNLERSIRVKRFVEHKSYEKSSTRSLKQKKLVKEVSNSVARKSKSATSNNKGNSDDYAEVIRTDCEDSARNTGTSIDMVKRVPLSAADLVDIAKQVAVGMEFLAKNKVVHRDLAARNVLVSSDRSIKIADFGLSRDVYQENIYKKTGNGKLPIKWLALESMTHQVYTTQSDVWSYGILLYEIATLGGTPYPTTPTNALLGLLKSGYRMEKPKHCGQEFYNLMYSCWSFNPAERPNFTEIIKTLNNLMTKAPPQRHQINNSTRRKAEIPQDVRSDGDAYLKPL